MENQRLQGGRVVQRHVLYLGEISPSQAAAWRKSIAVFDEAAGQPRTLALFPEDRCAAAAPDGSVVQLRLSEMRLCRPRQWGACWLAGQVWEDLHYLHAKMPAVIILSSRWPAQASPCLVIAPNFKTMAAGSITPMAPARRCSVKDDRRV